MVYSQWPRKMVGGMERPNLIGPKLLVVKQGFVLVFSIVDNFLFAIKGG